MQLPKSSKRLCLSFRNLSTIPQEIIQQYAAMTKELDVSHNSFKKVDFLRYFVNAEVLILDYNEIDCKALIPRLEKVHTVWINKNRIENLITFIDKVNASFPNLKSLSMLGNEACPNYLNDQTLMKYTDYRSYVLCKLKNLEILDDKKITTEERNQANSVYGNITNKSAYDLRVETKKKKSKKQQKRKQKLKEVVPQVDTSKTEDPMPREPPPPVDEDASSEWSDSSDD